MTESCAERITGEWAYTREVLNALLEYAFLDEEHPEYGNLNEYGLAFDYVPADTFEEQPTGYFRYQLSYGGPSAEIRFFTNPQFNLDRAEYWFMDWFDGAHLVVTEDVRELWEYQFEGLAHWALERAE